MADIRKSVVGDKSLSTYAHNVKIIAVHGQVTLKGPVRSDDESKNIEAKAKEVAGDSNVTNQLTVKAAKMSSSTSR
jgi:osmotically-inducible protein OsmY